jgi:ubiquinone/menaquinone biosynthesis C-methylase UbiE
MALRRRRGRVNRMCDMASVEVSRAYDDVMSPMERWYDQIAHKITRHAPEAPSVLDVGTGPGFLLPRLATAYPTATITGLDTGPEMLVLSRERVEAAGVGDRVRLVQGSAYDMPFDDSSFDLVVATSAIHMLDDLPSFVGEARRVLKGGGTLVVVDQRRDVALPVYAVAWVSTFALRILGKSIDGMGPVIDGCYTKSEVESALAGAGFATSEVSAGVLALEAWGRA